MKDSKGTKFANSLQNLKDEPHFGLVNGVINCFKPGSALLIGSSLNSCKFLHNNVKRFMVVDFTTNEFNKNVSYLTEKPEFYPKLFPVFDDKIIKADEGLVLSDLYSRIKKFYKKTDALIINQERSIARGILNYFENDTDIVVMANTDPVEIKTNNFVKYKLSMRYSDTCTLLLKNHLSVNFDSLKSEIDLYMRDFYTENGITPSFRFEQM